MRHAAHGVPLLAGTDAGAVGVYPGFSLHDELESLVRDAGLTPREALWSATAGPARFFGSEREAGGVAAGMLADLVLLDADPLADIRNTRRMPSAGAVSQPARRSVAPSAPARVARLAAVRRALDLRRVTNAWTLEQQASICEIPAPPFEEAARREELARRFRALGLVNMRADAEANVLGERPGTEPAGPPWCSRPTSTPCSHTAPTCACGATPCRWLVRVVASASRIPASRTAVAGLPLYSQSLAPCATPTCASLGRSCSSARSARKDAVALVAGERTGPAPPAPRAAAWDADGIRAPAACSRAPSPAAGVAITVRDSGIGIAADQVERVFEPFVQVRAGFARPAEGTGLGLAISRDLARGMNADLRIDSTRGVGSTFTLTLPRA